MTRGAPSGVSLHQGQAADIGRPRLHIAGLHLISGPFHHGLIIVFSAAIVRSVTSAVVSLLRGRQFYYDAPDGSGPPSPRAPATAEVTVRPNAARSAARAAPERLRQAAGQDPRPADAEP